MWIHDRKTETEGIDEDSAVNQIKNSWVLWIDIDETIYITDYSDHRNTVWKRSAIASRAMTGRNEREKHCNQLNSSTYVTVNKERTNFIIG